MRRWVIQPLLWLALITLSTFVAAEPSASTTLPGVLGAGDGPISYRLIVSSDPPQRMHVVTIDLTDPSVELHLCRGGPDPDGDGPWQTTLATVREIAKRENLTVAVNGNFFTSKDVHMLAGRRVPYFLGNWAVAVGWAMSDGVVWSSIEGGGHDLVVHRDGHVTIGFDRPKLPPDAWQAVGGADLVLTDGRVTGPDQDHAPRTCVGIDRDGRHMTFLVADGRRDDFAVGLTGKEVGQQMKDLGCWRALILDGGGSSTLVMRDPNRKSSTSGDDDDLVLMNRPSDGHDLPISMSFERNVACAFGVRLKTAADKQP